jgi:SAM-dependent methyltransferase
MRVIARACVAYTLRRPKVDAIKGFRVMSSEVEDGTGFVLSFIRKRPALKERLRALAGDIGLSTSDWVRDEMYRDCFAYIRASNPDRLDVLEISAGNQWKRAFNFRSYSETQFPEFDICSESLPRKFDLIIADQVFEHLPRPAAAARHVFEMLKPGGTFIIATPFLVRVHNVPIDCSRWTETGLSYLLQEAGFDQGNIQTRSWGNRACVKANFRKWRKRGIFSSMKNEPNFPVMVWAFAKRS